MTRNRKAKGEEIEMQIDGWSRFERAIDVVAKSPPQHRAKKKPVKKKRSAKRA